MSNTFDALNKLHESISKSRAVADLVWKSTGEDLCKDTVLDIGWFLYDEMNNIERQIDRLTTKPSN